MSACETVFFSGKGGVGKSLMSSAFAAFESTRRRVIHIDLSSEPQWTSSYEPVVIEGGFSACHLRREDCLEEYIYRKVKIKRLAHIIVENTHLASFFDTAPGIEGMVFMGKIYDYAMCGRYDCVVVDAPATGHGAGLFQIPRIVSSLFQVGPVHDDAQKVEKWLHNPKTTITLVTLLEELPVQETLEFHETLKSLQMNVSNLILNRVPRRLPVKNFDSIVNKLQAMPGQPAIEKFLIERSKAVERHVIRLKDQLNGFTIQEFHDFKDEELPMDVASYRRVWGSGRPLNAL